MKANSETDFCNCKCLPTKHLAVFENSEFRRDGALHIELDFKRIGFEEKGKPEQPEKNLSKQGREPTTNSTHIYVIDACIRTRATLEGSVPNSAPTLLFPYPSPPLLPHIGIEEIIFWLPAVGLLFIPSPTPSS